MPARVATPWLRSRLPLAWLSSPFAQSEARPDLRATRASGTGHRRRAGRRSWQSAPLPTGEWLSYNPLHGDAIPQKTTVWFSYDSDYLYFAFKCDDPTPAGIKTSITRRDNIWQDDWVGLSLDALGTGQLSYHMMVNPSGVQLDMLNSVAGNEDPAPDWIWDSAGRLTDTGYAVEIRLPLQSIRFKGGDDTRMGLMFWRRVSRSGVSVSWPPLDPASGCSSATRRCASIDSSRGWRASCCRAPPTAAPTLRESPTQWAAADGRGEGRLQRQDRRDVDDHARCDRESRLQPGRERRVPGRGQPALPDLLRREASVLHGRRRHLRAGRHGRRQHAPHRRPHPAHHRSDLRREADRQRRHASHSAHCPRGRSPRTTRCPESPLTTSDSCSTSAARSTASAPATTSARSSPTSRFAGGYNRVVGADLSVARQRDAAARSVRAGVTLDADDAGGDRSRRRRAGQLLYSTRNWGVVGAAEHYDDDFQMDDGVYQPRRHHQRLGVRRAQLLSARGSTWLRRCSLVSSPRAAGPRRGRQRIAGDGRRAVPHDRAGIPACRYISGFRALAGQRFERGRPRLFGKSSCFAGWRSTAAFDGGHAVFYDPVDPFQGRTRRD